MNYLINDNRNYLQITEISPDITNLSGVNLITSHHQSDTRDSVLFLVMIQLNRIRRFCYLLLYKLTHLGYIVEELVLWTHLQEYRSHKQIPRLTTLYS